MSINGPGSSPNSPASAMCGIYALPAVFMAARAAFTVPIDRERGPLPLTGHLQRAQRPAWVRRIVE